MGVFTSSREKNMTNPKAPQHTSFKDFKGKVYSDDEGKYWTLQNVQAHDGSSSSSSVSYKSGRFDLQFREMQPNETIKIGQLGGTKSDAINDFEKILQSKNIKTFGTISGKEPGVFTFDISLKPIAPADLARAQLVAKEANQALGVEPPAVKPARKAAVTL
jgi:hypothetical protein